MDKLNDFVFIVALSVVSRRNYFHMPVKIRTFMEKFLIISHDKQNKKKTLVSKTEYTHAAKHLLFLIVVSSPVIIIVNLVVLLYCSGNLERHQFITFYTTFVVCPFF